LAALTSFVFLSALDPGKQGLKPVFEIAFVNVVFLSALDPGKQGLKHVAQILQAGEIGAFSA